VPFQSSGPRARRGGDGRLTDALDPHDQGPQDACGVFGVWAPGEDVAKLSYFGLYALQHRGQESAGIAVSNGRQILVYKDMGLVSQVFDESTLDSLKGHLAIGHSRYSTTGASTWQNAQPTFRPTVDGSIALGHNGNLINTHELREQVAALPRTSSTCTSARARPPPTTPAWSRRSWPTTPTPPWSSGRWRCSRSCAGPSASCG
jgi:amidophosphoribosyltransferase